LENETAGTTLYVVAGKETGLQQLCALRRYREPTEPVQVQVTLVRRDSLQGKHGPRGTSSRWISKERKLAALQGARELLAKHPRAPVILAEMADSRTLAWGYQASAIYDFLAARGFQWFGSEAGRARCAPTPERQRPTAIWWPFPTSGWNTV